MASSYVLIANPGSASRKYALYEGTVERAQLHFEWENGRILCTLHIGDKAQDVPAEIDRLEDAACRVVDILHAMEVLPESAQIEKLGLRIVAPCSYFLTDHIIDNEFVGRLEAEHDRAPIHISATLAELHTLREQFSGATIVGVSDSAFHTTKPDYAWNYGISLEMADHHEIKRYGYHGLSVASAVHTLTHAEKLPPKLLVCHLGSGASVTALHGGKTVDNTMGYSPLEGVIMSTRSGNIDPTAVRAIKEICNFDDNAVEEYLNKQSGLLGLGGSSDIRELRNREEAGDDRARLALATYVFSVQKAIGQMAAAMGGADALLFIGTVGERSAVIRERVIARLHYLDFIVDKRANNSCISPEKLSTISRLAQSKPIYVTPAQEAAEMARHVHALRPPTL